MACCFCGSDNHEVETCPWYGTGRRLVLAVFMVAAVGCTTVEQRAVAPRYLSHAYGAHVQDVLLMCSKATADAVDAAWAQGIEVTQAMMQHAFHQCLLVEGVMI